MKSRTIRVRISKRSTRTMARECELACDHDITAGVWTSADVMHAVYPSKASNPYALDFAQIRAFAQSEAVNG